MEMVVIVTNKIRKERTMKERYILLGKQGNTIEVVIDEKGMTRIYDSYLEAGAASGVLTNRFKNKRPGKIYYFVVFNFKYRLLYSIYFIF